MWTSPPIHSSIRSAHRPLTHRPHPSPFIHTQVIAKSADYLGPCKQHPLAGRVLWYVHYTLHSLYIYTGRVLWYVHHTPYTIHRTPYTMHHTPYTIHHAPSSMHHAPSSMHHTPHWRAGCCGTCSPSTHYALTMHSLCTHYALSHCRYFLVGVVLLFVFFVCPCWQMYAPIDKLPKVKWTSKRKGSGSCHSPLSQPLTPTLTLSTPKVKWTSKRLWFMSQVHPSLYAPTMHTILTHCCHCRYIPVRRRSSPKIIGPSPMIHPMQTQVCVCVWCGWVSGWSGWG
jgi:hypothetical protein